MNRNDDQSRDRAASEDTTQARENTRRAHENREALADQARRVEASVPASQRTSRVEQTGAPAGPRPTEDNSEAVRRTEQVRENRAALEEQARRTEASVPPEVRDKPIGQ